MSIELAEGVRVIDCDSHLTETHDLFTSRAPAAYKDRVPRVVQIDGRDTWVVDDGVEMGFAGGGSVIDRDGNKAPFLESMTEWNIERAHVAAYDTKVRHHRNSSEEAGNGIHVWVCAAR